MTILSKALNHADICGFNFSKEMLKGDMTSAINFDRIQRHPKHGYIIFEYQKCEESQENATPFTSNPNRYWHKCKRKYTSLWQITTLLNGALVIVNYADANTKYSDNIKLFKVRNVTDEKIEFWWEKEFSREGFSDWFRNMNRECLK